MTRSVARAFAGALSGAFPGAFSGAFFFRGPLTRARREDLEGRMLISPTLIVILGIVVLPFLAVILLAFQDARLIDIPRLGLDNLQFTLDNFASVARSASFWSSLTTTVVYATSTTAGGIAVGLIVALALREPFRGRGVVRALVLLPYILPVVAAATVWKTLLNSQYGLVNAVGERFLGWEEPIAFVTTPGIAIVTVIAFEVWKTFPLAFLFITARLQAVPRELEEAAAIDGASAVQRFRYVVLPQLRGVITLLVLLRFIWSFQNFNDIYLLTGGAGDTEVLAIRVYLELVTRANIGTSAATGLAITAMLAFLVLLYVRMIRRGQA